MRGPCARDARDIALLSARHRQVAETLRERVEVRNEGRRGGSALDQRTTRHPGYAVSQRKRKLVETAFGWTKQYGGMRRPMVRGLERMSAAVNFAATVFNLLRMRNLSAGAVV